MRISCLPVAFACVMSAAGCTTAPPDRVTAAGPVALAVPQERPKPDVDDLIVKYASAYTVPADLIRGIVRRESNFNPLLTHRGNYGLMQIKPATARTMGYDGAPSGLLDPETNLKYGVKYLRGAYVVAGRNSGRAASYYRSGYYYRAKRLGLLEAAGLTKPEPRPAAAGAGGSDDAASPMAGADGHARAN